MTKCHELGGLEQQWFIILDFWKLEIEINMSVGPCSLSNL